MCPTAASCSARDSAWRSASTRCRLETSSTFAACRPAVDCCTRALRSRVSDSSRASMLLSDAASSPISSGRSNRHTRIEVAAARTRHRLAHVGERRVHQATEEPVDDAGQQHHRQRARTRSRRGARAGAPAPPRRARRSPPPPTRRGASLVDPPGRATTRRSGERSSQTRCRLAAALAARLEHPRRFGRGGAGAHARRAVERRRRRWRARRAWPS